MFLTNFPKIESLTTFNKKKFEDFHSHFISKFIIELIKTGKSRNTAAFRDFKFIQVRVPSSGLEGFYFFLKIGNNLVETSPKPMRTPFFSE
jgi:hypothetical protein